MTLNGPNQLSVADITYVATTASFVYLAVILDAWSRRVVGYAISRWIDARLAAAALKAAINARQSPAGLRASLLDQRPVSALPRERYRQTTSPEGVKKLDADRGPNLEAV